MVARRDDERRCDHPEERKDRDLGKLRAARAAEHRMRGRKNALQANDSIHDNPPLAATGGAVSLARYAIMKICVPENWTGTANELGKGNA